MKKKLIFGAAAGIVAIILLFCMPFSQIRLASGSLKYVPPLPEAAPDPVEPPVLVDGQYSLSLESSIGILTYYNQSDVRWADYLYGGQDPMKKYGCGPTALAMIVSSFTNQTLLPPDMADWAATNHYWAPRGGTAHNFIPECAAAFGFQATSFQNFTVEGVLDELRSGHILVALMGPGHFTGSGLDRNPGQDCRSCKPREHPDSMGSSDASGRTESFCQLWRSCMEYYTHINAFVLLQSVF